MALLTEPLSDRTPPDKSPWTEYNWFWLAINPKIELVCGLRADVQWTLVCKTTDIYVEGWLVGVLERAEVDELAGSLAKEMACWIREQAGWISSWSVGRLSMQTGETAGSQRDGYASESGVTAGGLDCE